MFANLTSTLDFQSKALVLRAERQRMIASNIANADTPGYVGRDLDFKEALGAATGQTSESSTLRLQPSTSSGLQRANHIPLPQRVGEDGGPGVAYTLQSQPNLDGNSIDIDRERATFVDNSVRYEATLRFINGSSRTLLSAIQGQ